MRIVTRQIVPSHLLMCVFAAVCPEDVWIKYEVAMLICKADPSGPAKAGKVTKISLSKAMKTLLDRSLLQGSGAAGVKMHVSNDVCQMHVLVLITVPQRTWFVS